MTLTTTDTIDFKVNTTTGEAFVSTTKAAELLGIARSTLQQHVANRQPNYLITQGLTPEILQEAAVHYAYESKAANETAKAFLNKLLQAGAKAFIYYAAGFQVNLVDAVPLTYKESLQRLLDNEIERERLQEVIQKQTVVIDHKKIRTDDSMTHTTMVRVRKLNPNETFSSARLIAYCEDNEINIEKVYDAHDQPVNSYPNAAWEAIYPDVVLPAHL